MAARRNGAGSEPSETGNPDHERESAGRETSPYLLLHKDNPVHWRPGGPRRSPKRKPPTSRSFSRSDTRRVTGAM